MKNVLIYSLAVSFFLTGCVTTEETLKEQGLKPLDASQVKELLSGNTAKGRNEAGRAFTVFHRADGTRVGTSGGSSDTGTWEVTEEGNACGQWTKWRDGKRLCTKYYMVDDEVKYYNTDGSYRGSFKILPGNPSGL